MDAELSLSPAAIDALADDIADTAAHIDAATHRLLVLIREFDRARGWQHQGALTCAHWLSWRIGLGLGPAREKLRVAHKLADLPLLDEAFRRGELSYSKLRAMTRVATPSNEAELLELARCSTAAQLERICRFYSQARQQDRQDARVVEDERRWVVSHATEDGMVSIQIRLLPDEAARLMRAIELHADHSSLADGAVALAETALHRAPWSPLRRRLSWRRRDRRGPGRRGRRWRSESSEASVSDDPVGDDLVDGVTSCRWSQQDASEPGREGRAWRGAGQRGPTPLARRGRRPHHIRDPRGDDRGRRRTLRRDVPAPPLRCRRGADAGRRQWQDHRRRPQDAHRPGRLAPRSSRPRSDLSLSRLYAPPHARRAPRAPLDRGRRDQAHQRLSLLPSSPPLPSRVLLLGRDARGRARLLRSGRP